MRSANSRAKTFVNRDPRVPSQPGDRNFVRYIPINGKDLSSAAQFSDISSTGMRLISRLPAQTQVGDKVDIQFTLPGSRREVSGKALVVRRIGEFEFAVSFLDYHGIDRRTVQQAIQEYGRYIRVTPLTKMTQHFAAWVSEHRRGLVIAFAGLALFSGVVTWIYINSDEHVGRQLKSWAKPYPRQWDWDYVEKK